MPQGQRTDSTKLPEEAVRSFDEGMTLLPSGGMTIAVEYTPGTNASTDIVSANAHRMAEFLREMMPGQGGRVVVEVTARNASHYLILHIGSGNRDGSHQDERGTALRRAMTYRENVLRLLEESGVACRAMTGEACLRLQRHFPQGRLVERKISDDDGRIMTSLTVVESPETTEAGLCCSLIEYLRSRDERAFFVLDFACDHQHEMGRFGLSVLLTNQHVSAAREAVRAAEDAVLEHLGALARRDTPRQTLLLLERGAPFSTSRLAKHDAYCLNIADLIPF